MGREASLAGGQRRGGGRGTGRSATVWVRLVTPPERFVPWAGPYTPGGAPAIRSARGASARPAAPGGTYPFGR